VSSPTLAVVLQIVAVALLFAEIFLPSGGILGIATVGVLVASLSVGFSHSSLLGWVLGGIDLIAFPLLLRWGIGQVARSPLALRESLDQGAPAPESHLEGRDGTAETGLRPVGRVVVDGVRHEAVSTGAFVEPGQAVRVVGSAGGRLQVRPLP
jgi:membrane-bound serine protease (ClpP class)